MSDAVLVVPVDPHDPTSGLLLPVVIQRVLAFAREHYQELNPEFFTRGIFSRLCAGDPFVLVIALVEVATSRVMGHGVATIDGDGANRWVLVSQMKADGNVGDAVQRAILLADQWARGHGATRMVMATPRSDASWKRRYGFTTMRHLMVRDIGSPVADSGEGES